LICGIAWALTGAFNLQTVRENHKISHILDFAVFIHFDFSMGRWDFELRQDRSLSTTTSRWVWVLLLCWLAYSLGTLAWFVLTDPAFMGGICKER
jgi:hypothetical protein